MTTTRRRTAKNHLGTYDDTALRIRRGCACGGVLDVSSEPPDSAYAAEADWLAKHAGTGHRSVSIQEARTA